MTARRSLWIVALVLAAGIASPALAQADPNKVLRVAFPVAETGFDPQAASDLYSNHVNRAIFDTAYTYDYLARPFKLVPNTAVALPHISADGLVWTFRIKPGIYFNDDPAFKGGKRELTAADYVYSWKRVLDPKLRSPHLQVFDDLFEGADAAIAKAKETGKFDYDAPMEGLLAVDRYTIRLKLKRPSYDLLSNLTQVRRGGRRARSDRGLRRLQRLGNAESGRHGAVPAEGMAARPEDRARGQSWISRRDLSGQQGPADREIVARMKGVKLPRIGRIEITIIEESQPRLLAFEKGDLDYVTVPGDLVWNVMGKDNKPLPRFADAGVTLARGIQPAITFTYFNMEDPVVGGYTKDKVALRRAIGMAYNVDEEIRVLRQGQAMPATQVIPPGVTGYDPKFSGYTKFDPDGCEGAARQVRLRRPRQGRLARPARRQAAGAEDGRLALGAGPAIQRTVAAQSFRGGNPRRIRHPEIRRPAEDGACGPVADVGAWQHQQYAGGLPVPGAAVWRILGPVEPLALQAAGLRPRVRRLAQPA